MNDGAKKDGFVIYSSYYERFEDLSNEKFGDLIRLLCLYSRTGKEPKIKDKELQLAFKFAKVDIDKNSRKYNDKCEKNKANAEKRWEKKEKAEAENNANACERMQTHANDANDADRIGEDRIGKDRIGEDKDSPSIEGENIERARKTYGLYNNVFLTDEERDELQKGRTPEQVEKMIENLSFYMHNNGKTYRDHFATMCKWEREDKKKEKERNKDDCINDNSRYDDADTWWEDYGKFLKEKEEKKNGTADINNDG